MGSPGAAAGGSSLANRVSETIAGALVNEVSKSRLVGALIAGGSMDDETGALVGSATSSSTGSMSTQLDGVLFLDRVTIFASRGGMMMHFHGIDFGVAFDRHQFNGEESIGHCRQGKDMRRRIKASGGSIDIIICVDNGLGLSFDDNMKKSFVVLGSM
jgi:hypothetical protein